MVYAEDDVDSPCVQHRMNRSDCIARQGNTRMFNFFTPQDQLDNSIKNLSYICVYTRMCIIFNNTIFFISIQNKKLDIYDKKSDI